MKQEDEVRQGIYSSPHMHPNLLSRVIAHLQSYVVLGASPDITTESTVENNKLGRLNEPRAQSLLPCGATLRSLRSLEQWW